ncbi:tRNA-methyltransferase-domain-containing protein [Hypoxylon sp. NC1633]|nr:tRNA-methyltransferase-domain-containing protein [Hypoxylon sp. NC1633]
MGDDAQIIEDGDVKSKENPAVDYPVQPQEVLVPSAQDPLSEEIPTKTQGVKRPIEDDSDPHSDEEDDKTNETEDNLVTGRNGNVQESTLSKNQQRKLKRRKIAEERKRDKKDWRKEKRSQKKEKQRIANLSEIANAAAEGREPAFRKQPPKRDPKSGTKVPIAIILDCQFEKYMMEKEMISIASQVTRCYSDNRNSQFPVHLLISSFGGQMKERFETVLENQHLHWNKHVRFVEGDFVEAAAQAQGLLNGIESGKVIDLLSQSTDCHSISLDSPTVGSKKQQRKAPVPEPEADDVDTSVVYLTADSPYTLNHLEPNTCYVIGGIIDKNREKGLCYKIARQRKVRTAKLPIGEFMVMQSRFVLTTNQVMEIMLKWLETGDWGTAFMTVIPSRKGGKLKGGEDAPGADIQESEGTARDNEPENGSVAVEDIEMAESKADEPEIATQKPQSAVEVEGDNSEEGLEKNALDQQRWSAPPIEQEEKSVSMNDAVTSL